ncbi:MAG: hypothetical protein R2867_17520 [Caldilineaceae bacterium]
MQAVRVVIYGASLVLAVIEAGLKNWPDLMVVRIDPSTPMADAQVLAIQPHIVIVDGQTDCTVVCPTTVLHVDRAANNHAAILNNQLYPIRHISELVDVIQRSVNG